MWFAFYNDGKAKKLRFTFYAQVVIKTANEVISRCCIAKDGTELFWSACLTCNTLIFPCSTNQILNLWLFCCRSIVNSKALHWWRAADNYCPASPATTHAQRNQDRSKPFLYKKTWNKKKLQKLSYKLHSLGVDNRRNICHKRLVNFGEQGWATLILRKFLKLPSSFLSNFSRQNWFAYSSM